ncbi:MAG TPA: hypothetical protein VFR81_15110 [Longimicrobium sp.]|nr:hypothetical protein [Longimicrobium sp.]
MNIQRTLVAAAIVAAAAACSDSHPLAAPEQGVRVDAAPEVVDTPRVDGGYLGSGNQTMCADSTGALTQNCGGRGGMLGSGT